MLATQNYGKGVNMKNQEQFRYTRDPAVERVDSIEFVTGKRSMKVSAEDKVFAFESANLKALRQDDVVGTDLGVPFYSKKNNRMYLLFGDTYGAGKMNAQGEAPDKQWRSSTMAVSSDFDLSDGLTFDGWYRGSKDKAQAVIEGKHIPLPECIANGFERTKIPQGGIEVNGTIYIYYESIRNFAKGGTWRVNYQGVIKSTDGCRTFERVPDLTWFNSVDDKFGYALVSAAEPWEDAVSRTTVTDEAVDAARKKIKRAEERQAPYFAQCYPIDGKDGYVYIFGRRAGRQHGIKVMRVKYENIEKFEEHEYYLGNDKNGGPVWEKGYEGLAKLNNNEVGYVIASNEDEASSNMSVMWNEYLGKWMLVYFRPKKLDGDGNEIYPNSIGFRLSDVPYGNYGEYHSIMKHDYFARDGHYGFLGVEWDYPNPDRTPPSLFYGGFVHEKYTEQNGKVFYVVLSIAPPVYNSALLRVELV